MINQPQNRSAVTKKNWDTNRNYWAYFEKSAAITVPLSAFVLMGIFCVSNERTTKQDTHETVFPHFKFDSAFFTESS